MPTRKCLPGIFTPAPPGFPIQEQKTPGLPDRLSHEPATGGAGKSATTVRSG
jgi:hypothetical protein